MLATAAVAQVNTNKLPEIPAPATAPLVIAPPTAVAPPTNAVPHVKKKLVHKKKAAPKIAEPTVALTAGPATVASANLNLRGQAGLKGEVVGHLQKGDAVTVISQINLDKHPAGEPAQWAKILLPASSKVWVNSHFVDASNNVVTARKLNLRGGPSENYSVLGMLQKGDTFSPVTVKGSWIQIATPTNAYAFVAAMYLKQEAGAPAPETAPTPAPAPAVEPTPAPVPPAPPVVATTVPEAAPIVTQPAPPAAVVPAPTPAPEPPPAMVPSAPAAPIVVDTNPPAVDTNLPPPPPRVATHEGYVRHALSIGAPTTFELYDPASGNAINYLNSPTTNLDLSHYDGLQIVVTGEEGLNDRWPATPVLTVQKIYVLSTNPPAEDSKLNVSPRARESVNPAAAGRHH